MNSEIGGKAKGLKLLREQKLRTPNYTVLDFNTLQKAYGNEESMDRLIQAWQTDSGVSPDSLWAVRSSAASEDGNTRSFAGQFKSVLNVSPDQIKEAIHEVVSSYKKEDAYAPASSGYGVIIQEMLAPDFSGVLFSRDPVLPYNPEPKLTIIPGLGEKLVSGELAGYTIHFKEGDPIFQEETDPIEGISFDGKKYLPVFCSVGNIREAITPHLQEMLRVAGLLEKVYQKALDFEFAIQNGILYWLQIRPITTRELNPPLIVWDNTSVEANYPGLTLPLSISFTQRTLFKAYTGGARALGFNHKVLKDNENLLSSMCGEIDGALYYNVTAWQSLFYQLPFGSRLNAKLPQIWSMPELPFTPPASSNSFLRKVYLTLRLLVLFFQSGKYDRRYQHLFDLHVTSLEKEVFKGLGMDELKKRYKKSESDLGDNWLAPVLNGLYTMIVFLWLKRKVNHSRIYKQYPNFVNDILFSEDEVISVRLVHEFQNILSIISKDKAVKNLFLENTESDILKTLAQENSIIYRRIMDYIDEFGNRTDQAELKLETITYKENPEGFILYLKSNLKGFNPDKKAAEKINYSQVLRKLYPYNFVQRRMFGFLIRSNINRVKARENYRFKRTDTFAVTRNIFLQMGQQLFKEGQIETPRDVFYLQLDELMDSHRQAEYKQLIRQQKQRYASFESNIRPNRYFQIRERFFPVQDERDYSESNELKGSGCCSGVVEARVMVIDQNSDLSQDFSEYILIAHYFEPGWISLFYQAKGIISERGNLLSHTAIICRELNVPSIVGVKGLLKRIPNNSSIIMDGARGIIKLKANESI